MKRPTARVTIHDSARGRRTDTVAVEEPLEIRIAGHSVAVTMRTPGEDFELAAGFLFSEGALPGRAALERISYCIRGSGVPAATGDAYDRGGDAAPTTTKQNYNIVNVTLKHGIAFDPTRYSRHVYTTSSCGICGKASLDLVRAAVPGRIQPFRPTGKILLALPAKLAQPTFSKTGGLHAAALFDAAGNLLLAREDVGRHNALDKLIGARLMAGKLPAHETILLLSGRASFELVQKAVMAGIPAVAAIGAPSSLAIDLAKEFGVNLVGFLRAGRFNEYC